MGLSVCGSPILHIVYSAAILAHSTVSCQRCTDGIVDPRNVEDPNKLVPLLGQFYVIKQEQWIFPQFQFTCYGTLTRWIFRGVPARDLAPPCRVELETWQFDNSSTFSIMYQRQSTTAGNIQRILQDGPIFTYVLASPVQVQPGDIVGIEQGTSCSSSLFFDNILSLNISGTTSTFQSYRNPHPSSTFNLRISSTDREQDFIPLIEPVVESESTESETTTPEAEQSGGEIPIVTIVAAVCGGIIGLLTIVVVCVRVVCMTRHVHINISCLKERRKPDDTRRHSSVMSVQQNVAYQQTVHTKKTTDGKTRMKIPEQPMQLNLAYGLRGITYKGMETESTGEGYVIECIEGHHFGPTVQELEKPSNPMEQEVSQEINTEDIEHPYEYIL